jgi:uncharacterized membrane protein
MPYKDAENKRQWEREHREQRNARRRQRRLQMQNEPAILKRVADPIPAKEKGSGWAILMGIGVLIVGVGLAVIGATPVPRTPAN